MNDEAREHYEYDIDEMVSAGLEMYENGDPESALKHLTAACSLFPDSPYPLNMMGCIYGREEAYDLAILFFRKSLAIDPEFDVAKRNLMTALGQATCYGEAYMVAEGYIHAHPNDTDGLEEYAKLAGITGRAEEAREAFEECLARDPDNPACILNLAVAEFNVGNVDKSVGLCLRAYSLDPSDSGINEFLNIAMTGLLGMEEEIDEQ